MHMIKHIAQWVLLFAALVFAFHFPSDNGNPAHTSAFSLIMTGLMVLVAFDMFARCYFVKRWRVYAIAELVLYFSCIVTLIACLLTSESLAALSANQLAVLVGMRMLVTFILFFVIIISSFVILILDAITQCVRRQ